MLRAKRGVLFGFVAALAAFLLQLPAVGQVGSLSTSTFGAALAIPYLTSGGGDRITIAVVTNGLSLTPVTLHVIAFGNGQLDAWKDVEIDCPLTPRETTYFVIEPDVDGAKLTYECSELGQDEPDPTPGQPATNQVREAHLATADGILLVFLECQIGLCPLPVGVDEAEDRTLADNALFGDVTILDFGQGFAASAQAIPIQSGSDPDMDRFYRFDGTDYRPFPATLIANYIAPDDDVTLDLILFTPDLRLGSSGQARVVAQAFDDDESVVGMGNLIFDCFDVIDLTQEPPDGLGAGIRGDVGGHVVG